MDAFTAKMLDKAGGQLPRPEVEETDAWFEDRGVDEDTLYDFCRAYRKSAQIPVSRDTLMVLGVMVGIELGKLSCDPSWNLARELHQ